MKNDGGDLSPNKAQSETPVPDYPAKKLARQLDFTGLGSASAAPVVLPDHPQQPQPHRPHIVALVQNPSPQSQVQPQTRPQSLQPIASMPMQSQTSHHSRQTVKPESPRARLRQNIEVKDGTPKKQKQCNCKHSRCLKLYCECFASGIYCDGCNCVNCQNNVEHDAVRQEAVGATLERNPNAFRPKIASSPHGARESREEAGEVVVLGKHNKGCHCKKSGCLKKYCECFQANILCSDNCKCVDCKNFEGSEERQALFRGDHNNNMAYIQQAANAAITGAIGSSGYGSSPVNKKRKGQELLFGLTAKDPSVHRLGQFQQTNHIKTSAPSSLLSSTPGARVGNTAALGPSKFKYRSLLEGIIQPQDLKELCSVLVVYSGQAAKMLADDRNLMEKTTEDCKGTTLASSTEERLQNRKESEGEHAVPDDRSSGNQAEKNESDESGSDGAAVTKAMPLSPGTLALMCDEDAVFTASTPQNGFRSHECSMSSQLSYGKYRSEEYAEQERIILMKFLDSLKKLITSGEIKETRYSLARIESGAQRHVVGNGSAIGRSETSNQEPFTNGLAKLPVLPSLKSFQRVTATAPVASNNDLLPKNSLSDENGDLKQKFEKDM